MSRERIGAAPRDRTHEHGVARAGEFAILDGAVGARPREAPVATDRREVFLVLREGHVATQVSEMTSVATWPLLTAVSPEGDVRSMSVIPAAL